MGRLGVMYVNVSEYCLSVYVYPAIYWQLVHGVPRLSRDPQDSCKDKRLR